MLRDPAGIGGRTDSWGPTANSHTVLWAMGAASEPLAGRVARERHAAYPDPTGSLVWPAASGRAAPRWPLRPLSGKLDKAQWPSRPRRQARSNFPAPRSSQCKRRLPVQTAADPSLHYFESTLREVERYPVTLTQAERDRLESLGCTGRFNAKPPSRCKCSATMDRRPRWPVANLAQADSVNGTASLRAFAARPPLDVEAIWTAPRNSGRTPLASAP